MGSIVGDPLSALVSLFLVIPSPSTPRVAVSPLPLLSLLSLVWEPVVWVVVSREEESSETSSVKKLKVDRCMAHTSLFTITSSLQDVTSNLHLLLLSSLTSVQCQMQPSRLLSSCNESLIDGTKRAQWNERLSPRKRNSA